MSAGSAWDGSAGCSDFRGWMPPSCTWRRRVATCTWPWSASTTRPRCRTATRSRRSGTRSGRGCTRCRRSPGGSWRCRSSSTIRCGSRTRNFDLDYHVRRIGAPAPGGRRELAELAAQIASVPLDRTRPLWEAWVIEGLKHDRFGFVVKVHHSAIDGASGAEIMMSLYDTSPIPPEEPPLEEPEPEHVPSDIELVGYAIASRMKRAVSMVPLLEPHRTERHERLAEPDRSRRQGRAPCRSPHRARRGTRRSPPSAASRSPGSASTRPRPSRTSSG